VNHVCQEAGRHIPLRHTTHRIPTDGLRNVEPGNSAAVILLNGKPCAANDTRPPATGRPIATRRLIRSLGPARRPARRGTGSGLGNLAAVGEPQTGNSLQGVQLVDAIDAKQGDDPTLRCQQCPLQREDYVIIDDLAASMLTTSRILLGATDGGPQHFFAHLLVFGLYFPLGAVPLLDVPRGGLRDRRS
jgi:hypothetical protein